MIWLASTARLLIHYGLETPEIPHMIALASMVRPVEMRKELYATTRPLPTHSGSFRALPISRATIAARTGLSPRAQQNYDAHGATTLIQQCHALVEGHVGPPLVGQGYYADAQGRQWRRLPDLRSPTHHTRGSKAHRAAREAARLRAGGSRTTEAQAFDLCAEGNCPPSFPELPARSVYAVAASKDIAWDSARRQCTYCAHRREGPCPHNDTTIGFGEAGRTQFVIALAQRPPGRAVERGVRSSPPSAESGTRP